MKTENPMSLTDNPYNKPPWGMAEWMILALQGRTIDAIKALRGRTDSPVDGLKDAKDVVLSFLQRLPGFEVEIIDCVRDANNSYLSKGD